MILPLIMLGLLPFIPESPAWFMSKGRREAAAAALVKINRSKPDYTPEPDLVIIEDAVQLEQEMESESTWASLITDPVERRKLIYACGVMFAQQINGIQFWYTWVLRERRARDDADLPNQIRGHLCPVDWCGRALYYQHHHLRRADHHRRTFCGVWEQDEPEVEPVSWREVQHTR